MTVSGGGNVTTRFLSFALLLLLFSTFPFSAVAQSASTERAQVRRIGVLGYAVDPALIGAFRAELRKFGWIEGGNVVFEYRYSEATVEALPARAAKLIGSKVDVIVASGTPSVLAAKDVTRTVPIVMVGIGSDPTRTGLVQSLARPGGNVTGVAALGAELWGKRLQLFKEVLPRLSRATLLLNRTNPNNILAEQEINIAAPKAGLAVQAVAASDPAGLENAFTQIASGSPDALICVWDAFLQAHAREIAEFAIGRRLPMVAALREFVQDGALMSYGAKLSEQWRRAAFYVDRILKGTSPADLPVEQPMAFELVINRKTAKALGIQIPPVTLLQADQIID
ncbi:MAG TPA: ABC transporter substrate-binding protein [Thermoanaerobaculia bacterium]|nr:ABC transporter substrate-binding protein [Thermoanaerobaculia bacterium]